MNSGILIIVSGPSGSGKGTIVKQLEKDNNICISVSATTRKPRDGEQDGVHYNFMSKEEFLSNIDNDKVLEYNEYCNNYYGTPREEVETLLNEGKDVILEIDVNGASQVSKVINCLKLFILPPSMEILEERLKNRGTETDDTLNARLNNAYIEIEKAYDYDYVIVNDDLCETVNKIKKILAFEKNKSLNVKNKLDSFLKSNIKNIKNN